MSISDILSITIPLACTTVGAVWFLSARISVLSHRMDVFTREVEVLERGLVEARAGRANLWEKHNELTNRVTVVETKVN
tara:strand:- start:4204 stop:4440 length:237 start_codon:yes stop_codon:yes gene_type:complete